MSDGGGADGGPLTDGGTSSSDAGPSFDAGPRADAGPSTADAGPSDAGMCGAMDVRMARPCGPTERPAPRWMWDGASCVVVYWCECAGADCEALEETEDACNATWASCTIACRSDADCSAGSSWCEGGRCVPCDNGGLLCDIACADGWTTYERNGCFPCACAPTSECEANGDCGPGQTCYAGALCWDYCGADDPSCCLGNSCGASGCAGPSPAGCVSRGCPSGERCDTDISAGCASSSCVCGSGGSWVCTRDCGGGTCVPE